MQAFTVSSDKRCQRRCRDESAPCQTRVWHGVRLESDPGHGPRDGDEPGAGARARGGREPPGLPEADRRRRRRRRRRDRRRGRRPRPAAATARSSRSTRPASARRGATLYVTMEPCAHHGTTPPCVDAILAAGVARVVAGSLDPNPEAGGGLERLREAGVEVEHADSAAARRQNEAWRRWVALGPAVRDLQGRGHARRPRHAARLPLGLGRGRPAGSCTSCAPPRTPSPSGWGRSGSRTRGSTPATCRVARQPRRLAFGRGPLPEGSELELRSGPLEDELRALAAEGVQSLLLEGGPTLATAFLERRPRRQAAPLRRAGARRRRAGPPRAASSDPLAAQRPRLAAGRRGRPARGVPARAVSTL